MYPLILCGCSEMKTDELLDMIASIARKRIKVRGDLRMEVLLEMTYRRVDNELRQKQMKRKRKWDEMKVEMCKKLRIEEDDVISTEVNNYEDDDPFELNGFFQKLKNVKTNDLSLESRCGR